MLAKKLWVSKNFDLGVSNVLLRGLEFSNRFSESPVFAFLHFYNNVVIFNNVFFISAVFASQTFLVKVTQANRQMMMMTRMMMKMRMMMKTKAGFFFFQNLLNAQSSLCRNGGHSIITEPVAFISIKMKYIFFFPTEDEKMEIIDHTETNLVALRRTIYLTIQSRYCMSQNLIPI